MSICTSFPYALLVPSARSGKHSVSATSQALQAERNEMHTGDHSITTFHLASSVPVKLARPYNGYNMTPTSKKFHLGSHAPYAWCARRLALKVELILAFEAQKLARPPMSNLIQPLPRIVIPSTEARKELLGLRATAEFHAA